jgi:PPP family 3-phenylpropionic acid transporter
VDCHPGLYALINKNIVILGKVIRTSLNAAWPLVDSYAVKAAGSGQYGSIRLWGSLSWGASGLLVGYILDFFYKRFGYDSIFGLSYFMVSLLVLIIVYFFPQNVNVKDLKKQRVTWKAFEPLMNRKVFNFLAVNFMFGLAVSVSTGVVPAWTKVTHKATSVTLGAILFASVFLGLFVFHHSSFLLQRFGAKQLLMAAHLGHFFRLCCYFQVTEENNYYLLPLIETLHCFSFALFWNASTSILHSLAPDEILVTAQTVLSSVHMNIAQMLGSSFFLSLFQSYGFFYVVRLGLIITMVSLVMVHFMIGPMKHELFEVIEKT